MANYIAVMSAVADAVRVTLLYFYTLYEYIYLGKSYTSGTTFQEDTWARVQIYSLSLIFKLWSKPHYRSPTFQQDMIDNLSNVAIPGTTESATIDEGSFIWTIYVVHCFYLSTVSRRTFFFCPIVMTYDNTWAIYRALSLHVDLHLNFQHHCLIMS